MAADLPAQMEGVRGSLGWPPAGHQLWHTPAHSWALPAVCTQACSLGGGAPAPGGVAATVFPYSASYGRTTVKTLLLAPDGGKSMVRASWSERLLAVRAPALSRRSGCGPEAQLLSHRAAARMTHPPTGGPDAENWRLGQDGARGRCWGLGLPGGQRWQLLRQPPGAWVCGDGCVSRRVEPSPRGQQQQQQWQQHCQLRWRTPLTHLTPSSPTHPPHTHAGHGDQGGGRGGWRPEEARPDRDVRAHRGDARRDAGRHQAGAFV
jgi:hypothetical protein